MSYFIIRICNPFEILKDSVDVHAIDAMKLRLLGATILFMHETIRIMNMGHL